MVSIWKGIMMSNYTPRTRMRLALDHKEPDRVPIDIGGFQSGITSVAYENLKRKLGVSFKTHILERTQQLAELDEEILERLGVDTRYIFMRPSASWDSKEETVPNLYTEYTDEWGTRWRKPQSSHYFDPVGFPLASASIDDLRDCSWPDPDDLTRIEGLREKAKNLWKTTDYAIFTSIAGIFERSWFLTGFEQLLTRIIEDPRFIMTLMDKVLEIEVGIYNHLLGQVGEYLDVIVLSDDISTQQGPLFSPVLYRKIVKPRMEELIQFIKQKSRAKVAFHSCGSVSWAIDDLIDIGVEILNPLQVSAAKMDTKILKEKYGKVISFWGAIDTQRVLPYGTPQEVREEVKRRIDDLAPEGGYIMASVHNIQPDVPPENIIAMYEACIEYGRY